VLSGSSEAELIARSLTDEHSKVRALSSVAKATGATDPDRAERIARPSPTSSRKHWR
jgi:hypothetical protein